MGRGAQTEPAGSGLDPETQAAIDAVASYNPDASAAVTPIGVPADYRAPTRSFPSPYDSRYGRRSEPAPLYYPNDVLKPTTWTRDQRLGWQLQLANAGVLSSEDWAPGSWGQTTQTAYREVLAYANQNGMTKEEAIRHLAANPTLKMLRGAMKGSGGGGGSGRSVTLANPQDLQAVANEVAPKTIGRKFTQAELDSFVKSFHGAQGGGNPPQMDVAAEAQARQVDPTAATARDKVGVFDVALRMMSGGGGGG